jgi:hypothetical protein
VTLPPRLLDRPAFAQLAFAPLGLLLCAAPLHAAATAAGPSVSALAVDLLAIGVSALLAWLGGDLTTSGESPIGRPHVGPIRARSRLSRRAA